MSGGMDCTRDWHFSAESDTLEAGPRRGRQEIWNEQRETTYASKWID